jgi:hypothetical protein
MSNGTLTTGKLVLTNTTTNVDAFDRFRVSEPATLYELNHYVDKRERYVDEITQGSGTSTYNLNAYVQMSLSSSGTGAVIRQTYEYIPYQPGKSRLMLFSGVLEALSGGVSGVSSRVGCFDDGGNKIDVYGAGNGLFFELTGNGLYIVERQNNSNTSVIQSSWNTDVFDGSGDSSTNPSGLLINDYSKAVILGIDQEWLGVGRTRFGFIVNGEFRVGHIMNHSGVGTPSSTAITYPYTASGKLPIRYEIISSTPADAEMRMICSTVISEGGYEPIGEQYSNSTITATSITSNMESSPIPIMSLRLIESRNTIRKTLIIKDINVLNTGGASNYITWKLYLLDDDTKLTGESFSNVSITSAAQVDEAATAVNITNAPLIASGFADIKSQISLHIDSGYINSPIVNASISGKSKILCLTGNKVNNNCDVYGGISWLEVG